MHIQFDKLVEEKNFTSSRFNMPSCLLSYIWKVNWIIALFIIIIFTWLYRIKIINFIIILKYVAKS